MRRLPLFLALCLPLCLILAPHTPSRQELLTTPLADVEDDGGQLPDDAKMERLARTDPVAFLENCLRRYHREVKSYQLTLQKQERLEGKLQRSEIMEAWFREEPFSVLLEWKEGARLANRVMYVRGQNNEKLLVKPAGLLSLAGIVEREPLGPEAKQSGRYPLTEFGIAVGMQRTLASWRAARDEKALHIEYQGEKKIREAGDRLCYVFKRTGYLRPEEDGIVEYTTYIDKETWLQVGSILKGAEGQLLGEYFFRDIKLNPKLDEDTFTRKGLAR